MNTMNKITLKEVNSYVSEFVGPQLGSELTVGGQVSPLTGGDYNLNFRAPLVGQDVVVRINVEAQSGRDNQIRYEFDTLKFLQPAGVTPKAFLLDESKKYFPYHVLVEEFIPGNHLQFSVEAMRRTARAMARLHSAPIAGHPNLLVRQYPLQEQFDAVVADLEGYRVRRDPNKETLELGQSLVSLISTKIDELSGHYAPTSIIHTDPNPANIIDDGSNVHLVDWEQGRIDDPSYDIAAFFSNVLNLWASPRILTEEEKASFLKEYKKEAGDTSIVEKIAPRLAIYTLNASVWAANRIADVDEGVIDAHLGSQNYERYKAMADPVELQKVINQL